MVALDGDHEGRPVSGTSGLRLRRISGHCTVTSREVFAWYRLPLQGWSFRPDSSREQLITSAADTLARLVGRRLHLRTTSRPYPLHAWAMAHDVNAPAPLPCWPDYLIGEQRHLSSKTLQDKDVYLGVEIPSRAGEVCFAVSQADRLWKNVLVDRTLAIHLPPPFDPSRTRIELLAVMGSDRASP